MWDLCYALGQVGHLERVDIRVLVILPAGSSQPVGQVSVLCLSSVVKVMMMMMTMMTVSWGGEGDVSVQRCRFLWSDDLRAPLSVSFYAQGVSKDS